MPKSAVKLIDRIDVGCNVDIQRSDGRVHAAAVRDVNCKDLLVTVGWLEKGKTKGKEFDMHTLIELNPKLKTNRTINQSDENEMMADDEVENEDKEEDVEEYKEKDRSLRNAEIPYLHSTQAISLSYLPPMHHCKTTKTIKTKTSNKPPSFNKLHTIQSMTCNSLTRTTSKEINNHYIDNTVMESLPPRDNVGVVGDKSDVDVGDVDVCKGEVDYDSDVVGKGIVCCDESDEGRKSVGGGDDYSVTGNVCGCDDGVTGGEVVIGGKKDVGGGDDSGGKWDIGSGDDIKEGDDVSVGKVWDKIGCGDAVKCKEDVGGGIDDEGKNNSGVGDVDNIEDEVSDGDDDKEKEVVGGGEDHNTVAASLRPGDNMVEVGDKWVFVDGDSDVGKGEVDGDAGGKGNVCYDGRDGGRKFVGCGDDDCGKGLVGSCDDDKEGKDVDVSECGVGDCDNGREINNFGGGDDKGDKEEVGGGADVGAEEEVGGFDGGVGGECVYGGGKESIQGCVSGADSGEVEDGVVDGVREVSVVDDGVGGEIGVVGDAGDGVGTGGEGSGVKDQSSLGGSGAADGVVKSLLPPFFCVICSHVNSRKEGRYCNGCHAFSHLTCIKMSKTYSAKLAVWKCRQCLLPCAQLKQPIFRGVAQTAEEILTSIPIFRKTRRIPLKIPKSVRHLAADTLCTLISRALEQDSAHAWNLLFLFPTLALGIPHQVDNHAPRRISLSALLKHQIQNFVDGFLPPLCPVPISKVPLVKDLSKNIRDKVNAKLMEGDVSAAVRVVTEDTTVIKVTPEVFEALRLKHPDPPLDIRNIDLVINSLSPSLASISAISLALNSFAKSSCGGVDGLRPGHLRDLVAPGTDEAGVRLGDAIVRLADRLLRAEISVHARTLLFAANLTALRKKDGGIRPIAVGNVFRRIAAKVACRSVKDQIGREFSPVQLGVGVASGCEAAVHASRNFIKSYTGSQHLLVKLDLSNAFNSVRRDHVLEVCKRRCSSLFPLAHISYNSPSLLITDGGIIESASGVQQGDPLGPVLFALAVDEIARSVVSDLNIWYLDDATIGGPADTVLQDLVRIVPALSEIGLEVNPSKSEMINISYCTRMFVSVVSSFSSTLPGARVTEINDLEILGSPILSLATRRMIAEKTFTLKIMSERLQFLDSHQAFFLLKNCFGAPKILFLLRSSPCFKESESLHALDLVLRQCASAVCNVVFDETGWSQAKLPVRFGGLGLRCSLDLALPAYLSSLSSCQPLTHTILQNPFESVSESDYGEAVEAWQAFELKVPVLVTSQRCWDEVMSLQTVDRLRPLVDQHRLACLMAGQQPHSGSWLNALPSPGIGTMLDNDTFRISVCLRLGLRVCQTHLCRCGDNVDEYGLHPLSCRLSAGRIPRHSALNDTVQRALSAAGFPSVLEPPGLDRGDNKRPDGITLFPFAFGKALIWDATCCDTYSPSHMVSSAASPGSVAKDAEDFKIKKYSVLSEKHIFKPLAVETAGVFGPTSLSFLVELGDKIVFRSKDKREKSWLFQRISLCVQRGNAVSILRAADQ